MALIGVEALSSSSLTQARELAALWNVPLCEGTKKGQSGVKVVVSELAVGVAFADPQRGKPYYIDFLSQSWKSRLLTGLPKSHIFRRALQVKGAHVRVIDATAGFGQDTMLMLGMGFEVIALEKSSVVLTLLRNGITRAMREDESLRPRFENLSTVETDAELYLSESERADVVFLDPMFEKPKKNAKSPKPMQLLQELLGGSSITAEERLFERAFANAKQRVVVKRPLKAKALVRAPSHSYKGQSIRYDVYLKDS